MILVVMTIVVIIVTDHDRGLIAGGVLMTIFVPLAESVAAGDEDEGKHED